MPASVALLVLVLMYWHFHRGRLVFVINAHQKLRPDVISHILICYYFLAFCYFFPTVQLCNILCWLHTVALCVLYTFTALQPLKFGTLSLNLSVPVRVLILSVVTSRPTTASRPSNPLNPSPLAPQIRLLPTIVRVYKLYSYLLTYNSGLDA